MLNRKTFTQINSPAAELNRVQQAISDVIGPVLLTPLLDGNLISGLSIPASGKVLVNHGLNRQYVGYYVTQANDYIMSVCDVLADQVTPLVNVALRFNGFTAGTTFALWVF